MCFLGKIGELVEKNRVGANELSLDWRIRDFLTLPSGRNSFYRSPAFSFDGERWSLMLIPDLADETRKPTSGWLRLTFGRKREHPPRTAHFSLGIRGTGGVEKRREVKMELSDRTDRYYTYDICSRSELARHWTRLMPDGILTIACVLKGIGAVADSSTQTVEEFQEVEAPIEGKESSENKGVEELQKSMHGLLAGAEDCDCLLKVQGREFPAHRAILRARSPVFRAMFAHDTAEKRSGVVHIRDCDPEGFPAFLEHLYTGGVGVISSDNVFSLYATSEKYDMGTLKEACARFMKSDLSVASFCGTVALAVKYGDGELVDSASEFFCSNAISIVKTAEWQVFLAENPTVGNELYIRQLTK